MITEIGKHKVQCGNIMDGIDNLMGNEQADLIYSDPPWGQGNLKYWQTINKRHTGKEPVAIDYNQFLDNFFGICAKYAKNTIIIEYGQQWRQDISLMAQKHGFKIAHRATSHYRAGSKMLPLDIFIMHKIPVSVNAALFERLCQEFTGYQLVFNLISNFRPAGCNIILDPMCGMGYTAQAAVDMKCLFRGNELNQKRLDKTIKRLLRDAQH